MKNSVLSEILKKNYLNNNFGFNFLCNYFFDLNFDNFFCILNENKNYPKILY